MGATEREAAGSCSPGCGLGDDRGQVDDPGNYTGLDIYLHNNYWGDGVGIDDPISFVSGTFGGIGFVASAAALLGPPAWAAAAVVGVIYGGAGTVLWIVDYFMDE